MNLPTLLAVVFVVVVPICIGRSMSGLIDWVDRKLQARADKLKERADDL